jgi:ATP-dependent Clp protease adaptor protein ClpS
MPREARPAPPVVVAEPEVVARLAPRYHVVLLDDNDHTYDYVIEMVRRLFGASPTRAFEMAREVDRTGRVILLTTSLEEAEFKRDQIHASGPDPRIPRCKGAMSAIVERAD